MFRFGCSFPKVEKVLALLQEYGESSEEEQRKEADECDSPCAPKEWMPENPALERVEILDISAERLYAQTDKHPGQCGWKLSQHCARIDANALAFLDIRDRRMRKLWRKRTHFTDSG